MGVSASARKEAEAKRAGEFYARMREINLEHDRIFGNIVERARDAEWKNTEERYMRQCSKSVQRLMAKDPEIKTALVELGLRHNEFLFGMEAYELWADPFGDQSKLAVDLQEFRDPGWVLHVISQVLQAPGLNRRKKLEAGHEILESLFPVAEQYHLPKSVREQIAHNLRLFDLLLAKGDKVRAPVPPPLHTSPVIDMSPVVEPWVPRAPPLSGEGQPLPAQSAAPPNYEPA